MIDKLIEKYGYKQTEENQYGVYYEKEEPQHFVHTIGVMHKTSGKHLMFSYDKNVRKIGNYYLNESCGLELPVVFLLWLKAQQMKLKYHWCRW